MIELDGSFGEGGGQILRTSLALSLLTGKPFHMRNIRARRKKPGLQPQHLMCVRAAATIGGAKLKGASKNSSDLAFEPGEVAAGKHHFAIGTAGATGLVLHTLYLPLILRGKETSEIVISGGTHVSHSPCYNFLASTWRAHMEKLGLKIKLTMLRPGFYPRGGGAIKAVLQSCSRLSGLMLNRVHPPTRISILSVIANLPNHIANRQAKRALHRLRSALPDLKIEVDEQTWQSDSPGTVLAVETNTSPAPTLFFALGERGKKAERVADEAVEQLLEYLEVKPLGMDPHSADQIVLPLALAEGRSEFAVSKVTTHLTTNIAVIRKFLDREIICEGEEGEPGKVTIE